MDKILFNSPVQGLKTSTEKDFFYEYVTTVIPFELQTTPEIPEYYTTSITGLYVLYGMGGILIFLIVYSILYGFCMPNMSDEALKRLEEENLQSLRERSQTEEGTERANLREVSSPSTISREVTGNSQVNQQTPERNNLVQAIGQRVRMLRETSTPFPSRPQGEERFSVRRIQEIIRSSTTPKQGMGGTNANNRMHENQNSTVQRSSSISPERHEERIHCELNQQSCLDALPNQGFQSFTNRESDLDNSNAKHLENLNLPSTSQQGRSQSSPTSPDIVRRRFSSFESTPRRPSSSR